MIQLDGIEYRQQTPSENASDMITYINNYCLTNDIKDSDGNVLQIDTNVANPLYQLYLAAGYKETEIQTLLYNLGQSYSIASSSDAQLLNLAEIAGIHRHNAIHTTIVATIYANETESCTIATSLTATVSVGDATLVFSPSAEVILAAGEAKAIILVADISGAYNIEANSITSFDTNPTGFEQMITAASVPGSDVETITSMRMRLQSRVNTTSFVDRCRDAILDLEGVAACNIYFNYSYTQSIVINNITIPARMAAVFVQGYNADLGRTYFRYMNAETVVGDAPPMPVVFKNNQTIDFNYITPTITPIYIRVYVPSQLSVEQIAEIQEAVKTLASITKMGTNVYSNQILDAIQTNTSYTLIGAEISLDNSTWGIKVTPTANQLLSYLSSNIEVLIG